ncbi:MAG: hypothetical protein MMC33_002456 [Icmadophila ericetorum]|nr:hypothetical protein [Icmadophila ericetorum]
MAEPLKAAHYSGQQHHEGHLRTQGGGDSSFALMDRALRIWKWTTLGTGNVGSLTLTALLDITTFEVTVWRRLLSTTSFSPSTKVTKIDFFESSLVSTFKRQDSVVFNISVASFLDQQRIKDAAIKAGEKKIIPSEFLADIVSPTVRRQH